MSGISSKALKTNYIENEYKFTGQLFDDDLELNWYQFKFRNMDPQIGRFVQTDPLSEEYVHNSTFAYAENDVIRAIDLEGLEKFIITSDPQIKGASVITYDPTSVKDLAGRYQVSDLRDGKTYTDAFPEQAMQKNLGGSFTNAQGNLYIQGDNNPNLQGDTWNLKDFQNPITGDNNPRDGNNKPFTIFAGESAATPMKEEVRNVTDKVVTLKADQNASGTFEKSSGTVTHDFGVPASSTNPNVSIMTNDGGSYHNNFNIKSAGTTLTTIQNSGTANVTVPANSTLSVQVTGIPRLRADVYSINVNITTTKSVSVTTIDTDKLKK
jgi:RHS repeat-associated protein